MKYFVKRIAILVITLFFVSVITFISFTVLPGDVGRIVLGLNASQAQVDEYNIKLGLDKPVIERYFIWAGNFIKGDFGESYSTSQPVINDIKDCLPATLFLMLISLILIITISVPLGIYIAKRERSFADNFVMVKSQILMSIPNFFLGILFGYFFGAILRWFTPWEYVEHNKDFAGFLSYLILPAFAIALPKIGMTVKFVRASVIEQKNAGYVRTAKGIGLSDRKVMYKHILKNSLIPVITFLGVISADLLAGSVVIEQIFRIRGIGRLVFTSVSSKDIPRAQGVIMFIAVMIIILNFVIDLIYKAVDPRVEV